MENNEGTVTTTETTVAKVVEKTKVVVPNFSDLKSKLEAAYLKHDIGEKLENIVVLKLMKYCNEKQKKSIFSFNDGQINDLIENSVIFFPIDTVVKFKVHPSSHKFDTTKVYEGKIVSLYKYSMYIEYYVRYEYMDGDVAKSETFKKRTKSLLDLNEYDKDKFKMAKVNFSLHDSKFEDMFKEIYETLFS